MDCRCKCEKQNNKGFIGEHLYGLGKAKFFLTTAQKNPPHKKLIHWTILKFWTFVHQKTPLREYDNPQSRRYSLYDYLTKDIQNTLRIPTKQKDKKTMWYPGLNPGSEKGH